MNIAKEFGPGVFVMTYVTPFEKAFNDLMDRQQRISESLAKLTAGDELKKSFSSTADATACLEKVNREARAHIADLDEALEQAKRCNELLPEFGRWLHGQHYVQPSCYVASKTFDTYGLEKVDEAIERGAIAPLFKPTAPSIDLGDAASNSMLRHRSDI